MGGDKRTGTRWSDAALVASGTIGWACSWLVGIMLVNNLDRPVGWLLMGIAGGLVTAAIERRAQPGLDGIYARVIALGWAVGGIAAGAVTQFDVLRGWIAMGIIGGAVTGAAVLHTRRSGIVTGIGGVALGWLMGGLAGAAFASGRGRVLAVYLGEHVSGEAQSFAISSITWAIAGAIAGAIGSGVMVWQIRRRERRGGR